MCREREARDQEETVSAAGEEESRGAEKVEVEAEVEVGEVMRVESIEGVSVMFAHGGHSTRVFSSSVA
jgi:hypothetical protein